MIYTITLNPAVDYFISLPSNLVKNEVNRGTDEIYKAGGKGLNVSRVLSLYGISSKAVCLLGGFTGNYIRDSYDTDPLISVVPVWIQGTNRINVKAGHGKEALVINGTGPKADAKALNDLLQEIGKVCAEDQVILSGSVMRGIDEAFIIRFCQIVHEQKASLIMDMELKDDSLLKQCRPDLIKPNLYELRMLMKDESITKENLGEKVQPLLDEGVGEILISLGKDGAALITGDSTLIMDQPHTVLVNKVGAGDAMLASYVGKRSQGCSRKEALIYAGAAGNATASKIENISLQDIEAYKDVISVTEVRKRGA